MSRKRESLTRQDRARERARRERRNANLEITNHNLKQFFRPARDGISATTILYITGILFSPITLAGALLGYIRGYSRLMWPNEEYPSLDHLRPMLKLAMLIGAIALWIILLFVAFLLIEFFAGGSLDNVYYIIAYFGCNFFLCLFVWAKFHQWQSGIHNALDQGEKFGTARFARERELYEYTLIHGIYLGGHYVLNDKGHILTVAGTRGGKGTNLIIPNLLDYYSYSGSWVVIDPKGENAAITARYQREHRTVSILNPWGLLSENVGENTSYNPLDILLDKDNIHLVDDALMIAEMIVPIDKGATDRFFTDNARSVVSGLLLYLAAVQFDYQEDCQLALDRGAPLPAPPAPCTLKTLWEWVRLPKNDWNQLLEDMDAFSGPVFKEAVRQSANEILKLSDAGDRTWGAIIAVVLQCTDFIKSPALQQATESGFDPYTLADGKTCLYIIIPADKLQSHARWLRLVTTTTMRAVVRKPGKRVTFLLDEFSALGYLPEIETALSTYAGFEITVWPILQSLSQLKAHYKDTWETFIGNSTIRQFFSVNDNFTADYVSKAAGMRSNLITKSRNGIIEEAQSNQRPLITPDELRRLSGENIFAFMGAKPITYFEKMPYYWIGDIADRADENPYMK